jgi:hypothetical protein
MGKKTIPKMRVAMALFVLWTANTAAGRVIYVDADANGANDGASWADAYNFMQDALADANSSGDVNEISVAQGVYKPDQNSADPNGSGDRTATFQLLNGVALRGGYAGFGEPDPDTRNFELYETILSGDLDGNDADVNDPRDLLAEPTRSDNSYHVVYGSGTDANAILEGFVITGGNANEDTGPNMYGGGIYNGQHPDTGGPTLSDCTFNKNSAVIGGGIYGEGSSRNIRLDNCTFRANAAAFGGGFGHQFTATDNPHPVFAGCTFIGNAAVYGGGGIWNGPETCPKLINCSFIRNRADLYGGGMGNENQGNPIVINCSFTENFAQYIGGGGMSNQSNSPLLTNCTFGGNSAYAGGGMFNNGASPTVINCTFGGNSAELGGGVYADGGGGAVVNCIFWGNSAIGGTDESAQIDGDMPVVSYSCVQGLTAGQRRTGNINSDPCFVAPGYWDANGTPTDANDDFWVDGDYHLLASSPCIDTADNNSVPTDTDDIDNDGNTTEPIPWDLDNRPRFVDGDCNDTDIVDMGPYEFAWVYIGDFDGRCDIDFVDYAILTEYWLQNEPRVDIAPSPLADGTINQRDLAVLSENWLAGK